MKILKKAGGILLVIIGILFFVSALKMIFVDNPKTKAALKDAVYVDAADTIDPENDGKTVIVCGTFELTEPAHDDELGREFASCRIPSALCAPSRMTSGALPQSSILPAQRAFFSPLRIAPSGIERPFLFSTRQASRTARQFSS